MNSSINLRNSTPKKSEKELREVYLYTRFSCKNLMVMIKTSLYFKRRKYVFNTRASNIYELRVFGFKFFNQPLHGVSGQKKLFSDGKKKSYLCKLTLNKVNSYQISIQWNIQIRCANRHFSKRLRT